MDTFGKKVLSGSVWVWDPLGIFLYVPTSLLDQVLVCPLALEITSMALYSHQGPYFHQIRSDFTLCLVSRYENDTKMYAKSSVLCITWELQTLPYPVFLLRCKEECLWQYVRNHVKPIILSSHCGVDNRHTFFNLCEVTGMVSFWIFC